MLRVLFLNASGTGNQHRRVGRETSRPPDSRKSGMNWKGGILKIHCKG